MTKAAGSIEDLQEEVDRLRRRTEELEAECGELRRSLEDATSSPDARFRAFINKAPFGVYRTTPGGRILLANPALVRMLGYGSFEELAARNLEEEGYHPSYPRRAFKKAMERDGEVAGLEAAWTTNSGLTVYVLESARAVRDSRGEILYYEGTVQDITARVAAEREIQEMRVGPGSEKPRENSAEGQGA